MHFPAHQSRDVVRFSFQRVCSLKSSEILENFIQDFKATAIYSKDVIDIYRKEMQNILRLISLKVCYITDIEHNHRILDAGIISITETWLHGAVHHIILPCQDGHF